MLLGPVSIPGTTELPLFNADQLRECADGKCSNCGRCCVAFEVQVSDDPRDPESAILRKRIGEVCPHLIQEPDGRYSCGVHDLKGIDPSLEICRLFNGRNGNYAMLRDEIRQWIQEPRTIEEITLIQKWMAQGLLSDIEDFFMSPYEIVICISHYVVDLEVLPHEFFEYCNIRQAIAELPPNYFRDFVIPRSGLDPDNPLHRSFLEQYAPEIIQQSELPNT